MVDYTLQPRAGASRRETIHVLKYGSDPLKTYLPDSDIDVTIIVSSNLRVAPAASQGKSHVYRKPLEQL